MSEWLKESKKVKETKAVLIYGPYPEDKPDEKYRISFPVIREYPDGKKEIVEGREWFSASNFEKLVEILKEKIG